MDDKLFWWFFWTVILICIVSLTYYICRVLYEAAKDLKRARMSIDNANEITTYLRDATKGASDLVSNFKGGSLVGKLVKAFMNRKSSK